MYQPPERNVWVLCTYAEKTPAGDRPNYYHVMEESLYDSLVKLEKMFPVSEFRIQLRNASDDGIDFSVSRRDGIAIAEMEFWDENHP